jgi:hypothetical protein
MKYTAEITNCYDNRIKIKVYFDECMSLPDKFNALIDDADERRSAEVIAWLKHHPNVIDKALCFALSQTYYGRHFIQKLQACNMKGFVATKNHRCRSAESPLIFNRHFVIVNP